MTRISDRLRAVFVCGNCPTLSVNPPSFGALAAFPHDGSARAHFEPNLSDGLPNSGFAALRLRIADNRTISQIEGEGYPWIGCECCKGVSTAG